MAEDSTKTEYEVNLVETEEIPRPDELIVTPDAKSDAITLGAAGAFKRGTLLMSSTDGFINATASGVSGSEVCILCDDIEVPEGSTGSGYGYFKGTFKGDSVILPYEGDDDAHSTLIEDIRPALRKQGIFIV